MGILAALVAHASTHLGTWHFRHPADISIGLAGGFLALANSQLGESFGCSILTHQNWLQPCVLRFLPAVVGRRW